MFLKKRNFVSLISILLVFYVLCFSYVCYKHELKQSDLIRRQQIEIMHLKEDVKLLKNAPDVKWTDVGFNYLAIGNSITKHPKTDFWWNENGMAATTKEKDFVHLIASKIGRETHVYPYNFYIWEVQAHDRAECLTLLDKYLDLRLNLITIQLSENVVNLHTFKNDFTELIHYIKAKAPKAKIIIIDDFWDKGDKSAIKEQVAQMEKVQFISLAKIKDDVSYKCGLGTVVFDEKGTAHVVEHKGVANHPGDKGMEYIANAVLQVLQ